MKRLVILTIIGILVLIAIPPYLRHTRMKRMMGEIRGIVASQEVEKDRMGEYYSASTVAEFKSKGIDFTNTKYVIYETAPTSDGEGFTITVTLTDASGMKKDSVTLHYPFDDSDDLGGFELLAMR